MSRSTRAGRRNRADSHRLSVYFKSKVIWIPVIPIQLPSPSVAWPSVCPHIVPASVAHTRLSSISFVTINSCCWFLYHGHLCRVVLFVFFSWAFFIFLALLFILSREDVSRRDVCLMYILSSRV